MNVKVEKLDYYQIFNGANVKISKQGNITVISHVSHKNEVCPIINIDRDTYQVRRTGEIRTKVHAFNRSMSAKSLRRSLKTLRELINTNFTDLDKCRWVTLTYRQDNGEPMTDPEKLYKDFNNFTKRFYRFCERKGYGKPEYVGVREPQGNGSWHMHVIFRFNSKAPFIDNNTEFNPIWGHGFTSIRAFKAEHGDIDNIGAYLTAYLADMDLEAALENRGLDIDGCEVKEAKSYDSESGKWKSKYFVKGARLCFYPNGFHLYCNSKGIVKPTEYETDYKSAKKEVSGQTLTYKKDTLIETGDFRLTSSKRYYNKNRKSNQEVYEHNLVDTGTGEILEFNYDSSSP
ncbi:MAG: hypothetical protein NC489_24955 [Ruminococcus flavefaciens]|nr:hypothetical protein [Ruminococcus flavefaciens]